MSAGRIPWRCWRYFTLVFLLTSMVLTGCATPVGLRRMDSQEAQRKLTESVLAGENLSAPTMQILNRSKNLFIKMTLEGQRLKAESQRHIQNSRHAYQDMIRALIEEGIREGVFRKVNSLLAARLLLGGIGPVIYGSHMTGTPQEMLKETLDIFFKGIEVC